MHWLNIVLAIYLVLGALYGLRRGLVWVGFSLLGYIAGVLLANRLANPVAKIILAWVPLRNWVGRYLAAPASHVPGIHLGAWSLIHRVLDLVVFLAIIGVMELVGRSLGAAISRGVHSLRLAGAVDRLGGIAAGVLEHAAVAALVMTLLLAVPAVHQSSLGRSLNQDPLAGVLVKAFKNVAKIPGGQYL